METKLTPWKIILDNDTGPHDYLYDEWFTVSNGIVEYECDTQEDAEELVKTLTEHSQLLQQRDELMEALKELHNSIDSCVEITPKLLLKCRILIQKHQI